MSKVAERRHAFGGTKGSCLGWRKTSGNIGIRVEVIFRWEQLGSDPVEKRLDERLEVGQRKRVNVSVPVTGDQVDAHQSADSKCAAKANIVGQFGPVS